MPRVTEIRKLVESDLQEALPELARLRIEIFHDFPYLYEGSLDYEERYLETYARSEGAVIIGAFDGPRIVGAATALPFEAEPDALTDPLRAAGHDPATLFYFGESVLAKPYRGQGVGVAFFEHREAHARSFERVTHSLFCAVIRADDHPLRPPGHVPLDAFWKRRGYTPMAGVIGHIAWQDRGAAEETDKPMQFWIKPL